VDRAPGHRGRSDLQRCAIDLHVNGRQGRHPSTASGAGTRAELVSPQPGEPISDSESADPSSAEAGPGPAARKASQPNETTLWLIRHAEVEEAYHNVFGGRVDMGLSPSGHQQARGLAEYRPHITIEVC